MARLRYVLDCLLLVGLAVAPGRALEIPPVCTSCGNLPGLTSDSGASGSDLPDAIAAAVLAIPCGSDMPLDDLTPAWARFEGTPDSEPEMALLEKARWKPALLVLPAVAAAGEPEFDARTSTSAAHRFGPAFFIAVLAFAVLLTGAAVWLGMRYVGSADPEAAYLKQRWGQKNRSL